MTIDWLKGRSRLLPTKVAVIEAESGQEWSYSAMNQRAEKLAAYLIHHQVKVGDRVALLAQNDIAHLDFLFACTKIGAIFVPLNRRLKEDEIEHIIEDCQPILLAHGAEFNDYLGDKTYDFVMLNIESEDYQTVVETNQQVDFPSAYLSEETPAVIIYTSGSTGQPKGAIISHRALISNALYTLPSWNLTQHDSTVAITPMFHTAGLFSLVTPLLMAGGTIVIQAAYSAEATFDVLTRYLPTHVFMVPTMYYDMLNNTEIDITRLTSVKLFISGGAPMSNDVYGAFQREGLPLIDSYGLTEVGPNNFLISPEEAVYKRGSVGKPNIFSEVLVVDDQNQPVTTGEVGELLIAGNHAFSGYWNKPQETKEAFYDRFVRTGDFARRDEEGNYYIVGRKKEMIISGGENVYPSEVETVLNEHPSIHDAVVVGFPDKKWGESVAAAIILKDPTQYNEADLKAYCAERLAVYKAPKFYLVLSEYPRTPVGKINKLQIAEMVQEAVEASVKN